MKVKLLLKSSVLIGCILPIMTMSQDGRVANSSTTKRTDKSIKSKEITHFSLKEALIRIRQIYKVDILFDAETVTGIYISSELTNNKFSSVDEAFL